MITRYIKTPLGNGGFEGSPRKKEWIPIALAAAGLATSLIGGAKASSSSRDAANRQREQENKENAWYRRRYNEDYIDTAAGQNLANRAKEYAREQWKRAEGSQAVAGGTEAATAQSKEAGNKMMAETLANVAATDQQRKAQVDDLHRQAEAQFAQQDIARENQRAANVTQAAQGASNAMLSAAGALSQANTGINLSGGSNKGIPDVSGSMDAMRQQAAIDRAKLFGSGT